MKHIIKSIKELNDPTILFMILFGVLPSFMAWLTIAVYESGLNLNHLLWVQAISTGALLIFFGAACKYDISHIKWIERLLFIIPAIGFCILTFYSLELSLVFIVMLLITFCIKTIRVCNYAAALPNIQKGGRKNAKLALVMMLLPISQASSYAILGGLAEISIKLTLGVIAISFAALFSYIIYKNKFIKLLPKPIKFPKVIANKSKAILLVNILYAAPYYLIIYIITPLYLYEKTSGDFGFIGLILSLICLVSIISKSLKSEVEHSTLKTGNIAVYSILTSAVAFVIWALSDNLWLVTAMLIIHTLSHRMFSFSILSELEASDPEHYGQYTKVKELYQHLAAFLTYTTCAYFVDNIIDHTSNILMVFAAVYTVTAIILIWSNNKHQ